MGRAELAFLVQQQHGGEVEEDEGEVDEDEHAAADRQEDGDGPYN